MKKIMKLLVIVALLLLNTLFGCSDKNNPLVQPTTFTIDHFPTEIGTVWQYQRTYNGLSSTVTDTFYVRIDGTTQITDDSLFVYMVIYEKSSPSQYTDPTLLPIVNDIDTTYWHISGDTVTYYNRLADSIRLSQRIIFPLEVGSVWTTTPSMVEDTSEVTGNSSCIVLDKSYSNCYEITRHSTNCTECYQHNLFVPNIGLIRSSSFAPYINIPNPVWKLISFNEPDSFSLSDFPLQVGASWDYKVYNTMVDCIACYDSVTVQVLDSKMDRGGIIKSNWLFDYPNHERILSDSLDNNKLFLQWHHSPVYFSLEFPLSVGKQWADDGSFFSSVQVMGRQSVVTGAGIFKDAYYLEGRTRGSLDSSTFHIWIAKGVGIVKLSHNSTNDYSFEDKIWELHSHNPQDTSKSFTIDKFPNYAGMTRTFEVFDHTNLTYDTVFVQVAESSLVAIWNYTNSDSSWQEIISIEGNVATFISSGRIHISYKSYEFPITVGNSWTTYPFGNVTNVLYATTILIPAPVGRLFPCYSIWTTYNCGDGCIQREIESVHPSIGIVGKHIYIPHLNISVNWRLIDYYNP